MVWQSEMVLYGWMILNSLVVAALLVGAWRGGHFRDLDRAADVLLQDAEPAAEETRDEP